ncbi:hypothetical protein BCR44DRAFT_41413 [Catenaria anguillulae PL171]|uniref:Uncharacterized protein n=1 Tax=Catenaria anguillulae PL171 TaxID=765915 RepID=A0A1Y2HSD2_9FUNG|nr:hypothetical protein BCR44DRAFT_41413 [Catenaria anguillulae PL171]
MLITATTSGSATIERVDPGCYYNCRKQGHVDCDWLCNVPSPDIPMAAAPAKPALAKRDYQCYIGCTSGCYGDNKCMDRCARQCVGSGRPPRKQ